MPSKIEIEPAEAVEMDGQETSIWLVLKDGETVCVCYSGQRAMQMASALMQNEAMREVVQSVAFSEQIHPYGPIECPFRCAHSFADETGQFTLDHSSECPVSKARSVLAALV